MKLVLLKNNLVDALNAVEGSVGDNINLPILKNVLISTDDGKITITTTNLETAAKYSLSGKIIEKGSIAVPFGVFNNIAKNINSERVSLEKNDQNLSITTDNYEASVRVQDPKEFPIIPSIQNKEKPIKIKTKALKNALSRVVVATQYSDVRPEISGVFLGLENKELKLVATDSFRLAEVFVDTREFETKIEETAVIIPLKTTMEILRGLSSKDDGEVTIFIDQNQALFQTENESLVSRLVSGAFPDYQAVIPKQTKAEAIISREDLTNAVKVTKVFAGRTNNISLETSENKKFLEVSASDGALGENIYRVPVKMRGEKISLVFNWRYLMDGLKIWSGGEIILGANEPERPATIKDPSDQKSLYIVMPIKT